MLSKILNIFELLVLLLIANAIWKNYSTPHPFFYASSLPIKILLDIVLTSVIFIRLKDLMSNFNQQALSSKKFYLPLLLYSITIIPNIWKIFQIGSYFPPLLVLISMIQLLLLILILIIRIIATKRHLKTVAYSEDILDVD